MIRRPPRSTHCISSAASDVYKRQIYMYARMYLQKIQCYSVNIYIEAQIFGFYLIIIDNKMLFFFFFFLAQKKNHFPFSFKLFTLPQIFICQIPVVLIYL
eukprot:TRINITY_DN7383_c0_g1_i1.p1 TRINITY_DN7383_c0_g1~~TRINITY_DN7383_c0_g1_i1.p1  ORF type:complete len:100 (-),score=24.67 TRINITY_DN7383_c0_g1_i1:15-314(-)